MKKVLLEGELLESLDRSESGEMSNIVEAIKPQMLAALERKKYLQDLGIRCEIYQDYDEAAKTYSISLVTNKEDVAVYKQKKGIK